MMTLANLFAALMLVIAVFVVAPAADAATCAPDAAIAHQTMDMAHGQNGEHVQDGRVQLDVFQGREQVGLHDVAPAPDVDHRAAAAHAVQGAVARAALRIEQRAKNALQARLQLGCQACVAVRIVCSALSTATSTE